jgi:hypothetical protein
MSQPTVPPLVPDSDSYEAECNPSRAEDEEVVPRPPSPKSTISQIPSSEGEDVLQIPTVQQTEPMQWTLPLPPEGV